jgi:hypothetical protein
MTRSRSTSDTFEGTPPDMADIDVEVFNSVCQGLIRDINLTHDKITGANSISSAITINHDGTVGNGALLSYPLINQTINKRITMTDADSATYGGDVILFAAPFFLGSGESGSGSRHFQCIVSCLGMPPGMRLVTRNSSGTIENDEPMNRIVNEIDRFSSNDSFKKGFTVASDGVKYLEVHCDIGVNTKFDLLSVHLYRTPGANITVNPLAPSFTNTIDFSATPASTGVFHRLLHDEMVSSGRPVPEALLRAINSNLCSMYEYVTGSPVVGNSTLTNSDSSDVNPSTSRFLAHTRSTSAGYSSTEPLIDMPLWAECFGAVQADGSNTGGAGAADGFHTPSNWCAIYQSNTASGSYFGVSTIVGYAPDFPSASTLKAKVLCSSTAGTPTAFDFKVAREGGSTTASAAVSSLSSPFYTASPTSIDFQPDELNTWTLQVSSGGKAFAMDELNIIGWCLYFEP